MVVEAMDDSLKSKRELIVASLTELFTRQSICSERSDVCVRCGAAMQYLDATFWLYQTDWEWSVRLPFCACENDSAPTDTTSGRNAA
jgi:hypothetical protein